jgi:hypothetical protein
VSPSAESAIQSSGWLWDPNIAFLEIDPERFRGSDDRESESRFQR